MTRPKRPRDPNQLAKMITDLTTRARRRRVIQTQGRTLKPLHAEGGLQGRHSYVVLAQGFGFGSPFGAAFHLSNTVIVALLTTATATVVGVFLVVVNYLFPKQSATRD